MKTAHAVAAWILLFLAMAFCSSAVQLEHNTIFWKWSGFTPWTALLCALYGAILAAMLAIAPRVHGRAAIVTMWTVLILLVALGVAALRPEHVERPPKPRASSPLLYRAVHGTPLSAPLVLVYLRRRSSKRPVANAAQL